MWERCGGGMSEWREMRRRNGEMRPREMREMRELRDFRCDGEEEESVLRFIFNDSDGYGVVGIPSESLNILHFAVREKP